MRAGSHASHKHPAGPNQHHTGPNQHPHRSKPCMLVAHEGMQYYWWFLILFFIIHLFELIVLESGGIFFIMLEQLFPKAPPLFLLPLLYWNNYSRRQNILLLCWNNFSRFKKLFCVQKIFHQKNYANGILF